jgi:hypothetical protein
MPVTLRYGFADMQPVALDEEFADILVVLGTAHLASLPLSATSSLGRKK